MISTKTTTAGNINPSPTTMKECKYKYGEITKDVCHCHCLEHGYVRCVHQDYTNTKCQHCQPSEERVSSKWEKEFELYYPGFCGNKTGKSDLKRWIKFLLQQRDKELIGKFKEEKMEIIQRFDKVREKHNVYNHCIDESVLIFELGNLIEEELDKLVKGGGVDE